METFIGKKVVVRAKSAGVFFGTLAEKEGTEVRLTNCRRLWYWNGAASISEIAVNGVTKPDDCKFCIPVDEIVVTEVIEIIPCTEKAVKNIDKVRVWKMS